VVSKDAAARPTTRGSSSCPAYCTAPGGPGPDRVDWLTAISDWVEKDKAPERLIASKADGNGKTILSRPLCPYPQVAVYDGKGDTTSADSFACGTR
jgi:feruloyl esterase